MLTFDRDAATSSAVTRADRAFAYVVLGVADIERALELWAQRFGMEIVARRRGRDIGLAQFWGLSAAAIADQALLLTPGATEGGIHLVQFESPGPAVRENASPTDLVPKSIDVVVRDIHARYAELEAAGYPFRSKPGRLESDGGVVFETHMTAHDAINVVLLEETGKADLISAQGYGVAPQIVLITTDNLAEKAFLESTLRLEQASHHRFAGPQIEQTIGLPRGAGLDIRILGDPASRYGRLEIVQYEGARGADRYPRTAPPARGMLSATYAVADIEPILARGARYGIRDAGLVRSVLGDGRMASVTSPAGFRIDFIERSPPRVPSR
jgi:catechol 2,3-dioxygenase-like lactoylglutathione lyase family enzyme